MKHKDRKLIGQILADGELTGHAHRVTVDVYQGANGTREFDGPTTITHEEHGPINIPALRMASGQVQEYDYLSKMTKAVRD